MDRGTLRAPTRTTLQEAADAWLAAAADGVVTSRGKARFKPSTLRGYEQALADHLLPALGRRKLSDITAREVQVLLDHWQAEGIPASTIRNRITPLRSIYRHAVTREGLAVNPTSNLDLPAPRTEQEVEIVTPAVATRLLNAVPAADRPIWATALYAGLRRGELKALRWSALDFAKGTIAVCESWDPKAGAEPTKNRRRRTTPMPGVLRDALLEHLLRVEPEDGDALVFGTDGQPFRDEGLNRRADAAWKKAGLRDRLRLHQARHTYASFMIAAGVNAKALSAFMGHSSITLTFDRYGHLMPGSEAEAAAQLDGYLGDQITAGEAAARRGLSPLTGTPTGTRHAEPA